MEQKQVTLIDYGVGNLGSVRNMFGRLGADVVVARDQSDLARARRLILPGVGAFDNGMSRLDKLGFRSKLEELVIEKKVPILGICLGMQFFTDGSEEGSQKGFGWISGYSKKFDKANLLESQRVPHMQWNRIIPKDEYSIVNRLPAAAKFYFAHSYYVVIEDASCVAAHTMYGNKFASVVSKGNVMGVQFHPEKSHKFGMSFLKNFLEIT